MKIYVSIMVLSMLIGIVFILNLKADGIVQGSYVPSVVLTAPWGEKNFFDDKVASEPGKFGFGLNAEGIECGPTAFAIGPNGDIYIGDALNDRWVAPSNLFEGGF
ncbi:MAG: hypothetical protein Q8O10_05345 [candidate division Zixibacteria bacterium]|nr:hypothetical protein [candidate division Zixibacteria bacterium]